MCNNKDFFERQQVEMLLSAELAKPYQEMDRIYQRMLGFFIADGWISRCPFYPFGRRSRQSGENDSVCPEEVPQAVSPDFRLSGSNPRCTTLGHIKFFISHGEIFIMTKTRIDEWYRYPDASPSYCRFHFCRNEVPSPHEFQRFVLFHKLVGASPAHDPAPDFLDRHF